MSVAMLMALPRRRPGRDGDRPGREGCRRKWAALPQLRLRPTRNGGRTPRSTHQQDVQRMIRRIAADVDKKPHDVLLEAVNDVLIKYGKPGMAEIDG
jgi:hypothetical protein